MTRPRKVRIVGYPPAVWFFKPQGIPTRDLEGVELSMDECEAIRLVDLGGLTHEEAAKRMEVSRPTLTRLVESAHKKIAVALFEGKALMVTEPSGNIILRNDRFYCQDCWNSWIARNARGCPECGSSNIIGWRMRRRWRQRGFRKRR